MQFVHMSFLVSSGELNIHALKQMENWQAYAAFLWIFCHPGLHTSHVTENYTALYAIRIRVINEILLNFPIKSNICAFLNTISRHLVARTVLFINFVPKDINHVISLPCGTEASLSDLVIPHSSGINVFTKKSKCQKTINHMLMNVFVFMHKNCWLIVMTTASFVAANKSSFRAASNKRKGKIKRKFQEG